MIILIIVISLTLTGLASLSVFFGLGLASRKQKLARRISLTSIWVIFTLGLFALFMFTGIDLDNKAYKTYAQEFLASKQTIEQSISNPDLAGFERIDLTNLALNLNKELARKKQELKYWYNCHLDDNILTNCEYIDLTE